MSGIEWFVGFLKLLHSKRNTCSYVIFYLQLTKYTRMSSNEWFVGFLKLLHSKINTCSYVIFYLQLTKYIYNTRSQFNNCRVLIVYQVAVHNKCSKCPPPESRHSWARLIMDCRTLSNVPAQLQMV
jgi:hypothetical protein